MKAITLWNPWAHALVHGAKNVENRRTLLPPPELLEEVDGVRPLFAIHAGLQYGLLGYRFPDGIDAPSPTVCVRGAVIGLARVVGALDLRKPARPNVLGIRDPRLIAANDPRYRRLRDMHMLPWWLGPIGWLLEDRAPLREPVPCRGALGCWTVPVEVEQRIIARAA